MAVLIPGMLVVWRWGFALRLVAWDLVGYASRGRVRVRFEKIGTGEA